MTYRIAVCQTGLFRTGKGGGISTLYVNLVERLTDAGTKVTVITDADSEELNCEAQIRLPKGTNREEQSLYVSAILEKLSFDVVESSSWCHLLTAYVGLNERCSILIRAEMPRSRTSSTSAVEVSERKLIQSCDYLVAVSHHTAKVIEAHSGRSVDKTIHNGVDLDLFVPSVVRDDQLGVVWIGNCSPVKRFDRLLNIVANCQQTNFNIVLPDSIESGVCREQLISFKNVKVHTNLRSDEIARLVSRSHVCLSTSDHESFGLVLLESLAAGTPLLVPRSLAENLDYWTHGNTGLSYETDQEAIGLIEHHDWTKYSSKVRAIATQFSWHSCLAKTLEAYRDIVSSKQRSYT